MDFALHNRDLKISNGDFLLCATDIDAITQALSIRLKTLAGEWFLNTNAGIPYLTKILGKNIDERFLRKVIADEVKSTLEVSDISNFVMQPGANNRSVSIRFNAILPDKTTINVNESIEV
jgi:hypothetical protein